MVSYGNPLLYGVGGIVVAGIALLVAFQEKLVYVPVLPGLTKSYPITPARLRLIYEDVWLTSFDGVHLHSWFIKLIPDCRGPTILFFQENAGNIAHRLEMVRIMLQRLQCNVFMLSYRGYGASDGLPSQHGITMDAQAALDHLSQRTDIDTSRIVVFGRSLGGAVGAVLTKNNPDKAGDENNAVNILLSCYTLILPKIGPIVFPTLAGYELIANDLTILEAAERIENVLGVLTFTHGATGAPSLFQVAALVLENTFTSILDMAGVLLPFLKWFVGKSSSKGPGVLNFLVRSPWSTIDVINEIGQPILFLSGLQDEMVPPLHMQLLYAKAAARNQQCLFVEFPTGMHMDTWLSGGDRYWRTIQEFFEKNVPDKKIDGSSESDFDAH